MRWITRNPKVSIPLGLVALGGLAWLAFGFFGFHLLFIDDKVNEAPPVFAAEPEQPVFTAPATTAPDIATTNPVTVATGATPGEQVTATTAAPPTTSAVPPTTQPAPAVTEPHIATEYAGQFVARNHPTSGNALVLGDGSGQRFLRFEQFETDNGPDLNVYLVNSAAGGVDDFVDLGNLKGNIGDQNYEIPADTDLATYDTVLIWCVRFASPFGEATLGPT